jgi:hypothetical protein
MVKAPFEFFLAVVRAAFGLLFCCGSRGQTPDLVVVSNVSRMLERPRRSRGKDVPTAIALTSKSAVMPMVQQLLYRQLYLMTSTYRLQTTTLQEGGIDATTPYGKQVRRN